MSQVISSVKAMIVDDHKMLFIKEHVGRKKIWDLPGGKIEYGETPQQALIREVHEELTLKVRVGDSVGVWYFFSEHHQYQVICHTFFCEVIGEIKIDFKKNPALDEDIIDHAWLTKNELLNGKMALADSLLELIGKIEF